MRSIKTRYGQWALVAGASSNGNRRSRVLFALLVVMVSGAMVRFLPGCVVRSAPPVGSLDSLHRLDALDRPWPGLAAPAQILWDEFAIPSIHAESSDDAAYCLGLVHAHLRPVQLELLRRVASGRLSESGGVFARDIDEAIRAIDLGRATPEMERRLPESTRAWLTRYVAGLNDYLGAQAERSAEAISLNIRFDEPWSVSDVLLIGRLASVDVSWGRWLSLLRLREDAGYDEFVARVNAFGDQGIPSYFGAPDEPLFLLNGVGRTGSNAVAVSGSRSPSGGALIASDPHLALVVPGPWCIVGYRFPGQAVVGLSIPGLPFVVVGRNEHIAWTGTNMQAASSVLYTLDERTPVTGSRSFRIATRLWPDATRSIRQTELGPVISDAKVFAELSDSPVVLRWRGHDPSDEATSFLRASQATDWDEFRAAFSEYAVSGQNMLFGDRLGNIGQIMAIEAVPAAGRAARVGAVSPHDPRYEWGAGVRSTRLPAAFNVPQGFIVSANNIPTLTDPMIVPQGNANDRVTRMADLLKGDGTIAMEDLATLQRDTYSAASHQAAARIAQRSRGSVLDATQRAILDAIASWDGRYETDSAGAAAYQIVLSRLIDSLYRDRYSPGLLRTLRSAPYVHDFVSEDLSSDGAGRALEEALRSAASDWTPSLVWGDLHRLRLGHPLGFIPWLGSGYRFVDMAWPGSTTTVYKSAHAVSPGRHRTTFGADARMLVDMGSLDGNSAVLVGGQDGRVGSTGMLDQLPLWARGELVPLPLSVGAQRDRAVRTIRLLPTDATEHRGSSRR